MARSRHQHEEHENHERWLVSYADFITLLFAFFVVMYAVSSVNEGKYRVLSDTLESAFQANRSSSTVTPVGEPARSLVPLPGEALPAGKSEKSSDATTTDLEDAAAQSGNAAVRLGNQTETQDAGTLTSALKEKLAQLESKKLIQVTRGDGWVDVEMKSNILFDSGSARLSTEARPILTKVASALIGFANPLQVRGYTDNQPINTVAYPSNWELSAARAASVVHLFSDLHIDPRRMSAVGYGEYHPKADNATADGRQQNRRVVIRISATTAGVPAPHNGGEVPPPAKAPAQAAPAGAGAPAAPPAAAPPVDQNVHGSAVQQPAAAAPAAAPAIQSVKEFPGREGPDQ
jgi:chemotaxis protein MotB